MNGRIDSGLGQIVIDTDVIATYAGSVAVECFGIVGMAAVSMKDGLVKLLRKDSLKHGISVTITELFPVFFIQAVHLCGQAISPSQHFLKDSGFNVIYFHFSCFYLK